MDIEAVKVLLQAQDKTFKTAIDVVVEQLKSRLHAAEETIADLTRSLEFSQHEVKDLQSEVKVLKSCDKDYKDTIESLKSRVMELEERQNYQEDYNRRNNIRITGIQEQPGETWEETAQNVSKLLEEKLQLPQMKLERAHRTGPVMSSRPRTVIARFERFCDREAVVRNARKLKGTGILINEDLCPASQEKKRNQLPLYKQAREEGKIAFFRYTRLIIKDRPAPPAAVAGDGSASGGVSGGTARITRSSPGDSVSGASSRSARSSVGEVPRSPAPPAASAAAVDCGDAGVGDGDVTSGGAGAAPSMGEGAAQRRQGAIRRRKN